MTTTTRRPRPSISSILEKAAHVDAFTFSDPPFAPPTSRRQQRPRGHWCRVSHLVDQTVNGRANVRRARDGRLYTIAEGTLRRLHAKPRGKAARRAEKEARRAAK